MPGTSIGAYEPPAGKNVGGISRKPDKIQADSNIKISASNVKQSTQHAKRDIQAKLDVTG